MIQEIKNMKIEAGERFQISPCVLAVIIDEYCNQTNETEKITPKDIVMFGDVYMKNPSILILNTKLLTKVRNWYAETADENDWTYHMNTPEGCTPKEYILAMLDKFCAEKNDETVIRLNI